MRLIHRTSFAARRACRAAIPALALCAAATSAEAATKPASPTTYSIPAGAVTVTNGGELAQAMASGSPRTIVLADGFYDSPGYFVNGCGHRLYAKNVGKAVLRSGMVVGGNWCKGDGILRGLTFNVNDSRKTLHDSVIHIWGTGAGTDIMDVSINGNNVIGTGVAIRQPEGVTVKRVKASRLTGYGIAVDANNPNLALSTPVVLDDVDVSDVSRPSPLSSNGTGEACFWIGHRVTANRLRATNCAWMGMWTGAGASGSRFTDVTVDKSVNGIGLYLEHFTRNAVFKRIEAGPDLKVGATCEWADPEWDYKPSCENVIIEDSIFNTQCVGVYFDEGTAGSTVRRSSFSNQKGAGIGDFRGVGNLWDTSGNNYNGIAQSARSISDSHLMWLCR
jgi:hypothetical protein